MSIPAMSLAIHTNSSIFSGISTHLSAIAQTIVQQVPPVLAALATKTQQIWKALLPYIKVAASLLASQTGVGGLFFASSIAWFTLTKHANNITLAITSFALGTLHILAGTYMFMNAGILPTPAFLTIPTTE